MKFRENTMNKYLVNFDKNSLKECIVFFFCTKTKRTSIQFDLRNVKMKHVDWLVHYVFSVYLANYLHICNCMCKIRFTS